MAGDYPIGTSTGVDLVALAAGMHLVPDEYMTDRDVINRMVTSDMPRLPTEPLEGVAFLYTTVDEAVANAKSGGTCFVVSKFAPRASARMGKNVYIPFWISNRHVVWNAGASVVRLNRRDGSTKIIDYDCVDWVVHPDGDDLAAVCAFSHINMAMDQIRGVGDDYFITEDVATEYQLGVGDDVVMIGRFVNHQGRDNIRPSVRFGSISMMPEPIWNSAIKKDQLSYAVEMKSRTGFSGSPVAMYRSSGTALIDLPPEIQSVSGLLGVCWGHIIDEDGENTWLNGVIPAWKILELLEAPKLKELFEVADAFDPDAIIQQSGAIPSVAVESAPSTTGENPLHAEDFNRLLTSAATGKIRDDQT